MICLLCGELHKAITSRHLARPDHQTTLEVYKQAFPGAETDSVRRLKGIARVARYNGFKHGFTILPGYMNWFNMNARCNHESHPSYKNYGARGIAVCWRWYESNPEGFINFFHDLPTKPGRRGYTLERVDRTRGYEPGNVVWATKRAQSSSQRHNNQYTRGRDEPK